MPSRWLSVTLLTTELDLTRLTRHMLPRFGIRLVLWMTYDAAVSILTDDSESECYSHANGQFQQIQCSYPVP